MKWLPLPRPLPPLRLRRMHKRHSQRLRLSQEIPRHAFYQLHFEGRPGLFQSTIGEWCASRHDDFFTRRFIPLLVPQRRQWKSRGLFGFDGSVEFENG